MAWTLSPSKNCRSTHICLVRIGSLRRVRDPWGVTKDLRSLDLSDPP